VRAPGQSGPGLDDEIEVEVEKVVYRGRGLARHQGQVVLVPRGIPGDRLRTRVSSARRGYLEALPIEVLRPAPARRPAPCAVFDLDCGGCAFQHVDYAAQLEIKRAVLEECLARAGVEHEGPVSILPSPEEGWRTRATFHVDAEGRIGLHAPGSHRVVPGECRQVSAAMARAVAGVGRRLQGSPALARQVRALRLAESGDGRRRVAELIVLEGAARAPLWRSALGDLPGLDGLGVAAAVGGRFLHVAGDEHVEAEVAGNRLRSHVRSFFQANRFLHADLVRAVADAVPAGARVLDLYAGVGVFALTLARRARSVVAVEAGSFAARDAAGNLERAEARNARVRRADVAAFLDHEAVQGGECIVLDPPRSGAGRAVVGRIAARRPAVVVYVSCDPPTLARDLRALLDAGYGLRRVQALDMFPDTFHVEAVAVLAAAPADQR
jgi:23S rRNA (uracil1939-C5)-methyltransferase